MLGVVNSDWYPEYLEILNDPRHDDYEAVVGDELTEADLARIAVDYKVREEVGSDILVAEERATV